tara:strand:+ start:3570 stop:4055 length:486 start_codon:yes stop_codon:yes gene_type:complete
MSFDAGELVVDQNTTILDTNITANQIRDLLNRPRGLNDATIIEYLNIRIPEIQKKVRKATFVGVTTTNAPLTAHIESAIKFMVCVDCLRVLIDTIPSVVPEKEMGTSDIRYNQQLASFERQAKALLSAIEEKGGTAFYTKATAAKTSGTTSGELSGSLSSK